MGHIDTIDTPLRCHIFRTVKFAKFSFYKFTYLPIKIVILQRKKKFILRSPRYIFLFYLTLQQRWDDIL